MAESTPSITFKADRNLIRPGESVTIRWQVEGVKEVYFFVDGEDWRGHGVAGVDERQVQPAQTTNYALRVVKVDDEVVLRGVEILVQEGVRSTFSDMFSVDRSDIQSGECVTFRWHVEGIKAIYFYAEGQRWQDHGVAGVAERQVCPSQTTTYRLRIVKTDDSVEERGIVVQVRAGSRIFSVDRAWIRPGECVTFRWHAEGIKAIYFYAENQPWEDFGVAGVAEQQVCLDATSTYCLRVVKADDAVEVHYITVTVTS